MVSNTSDSFRLRLYCFIYFTIFFVKGASVNLGKKNGLGVLLAKALGKENSLIIHHCSAHRDQLVFQKSMEKHADFVRLEKEVNAIYKVSNSFHTRKIVKMAK